MGDRGSRSGSGHRHTTTAHEAAADRERIRTIVRAFLHCRQAPTVREIARQFKYETGRWPEADDVERIIAATTAD